MKLPVLVAAFGLMLVAPASAGSFCQGAIDASLRPQSYHTQIARNAGGRITTTEIDLQRPDRFHSVMPSGREMLVVGNSTWMRKTGSAWKPFPGLNFGSMLVNMDPAAMIKGMKGVTCTDAGMGLWHAQPAHVYKATYETGFEGPIRATMYVLADGFVHHIDTTSAKATTTIDYSRFNAVTISPP